MPQRKLQAQLQVHTELGALLSNTRIRLLEAIDKHGSIAQAARRVPLSYKAAWDALDDLNNLADFPVIERSVGGPGGGGTRLTEYGRRLIAMFRAVEAEYQQAVDTLQQATAGSHNADKHAFQRLLRRINLRTSARNQFLCTITRVVTGPITAQVYLALGDDCAFQAQVTSDSVQRLELDAGREVIALVKAPAVFLMVDATARTTVSNHLTGAVSRIHKGPVNSEVVVDLQLAHTRHLTAVITTESLIALDLTVGSTVTAAFQASSVVLATLD